MSKKRKIKVDSAMDFQNRLSPEKVGAQPYNTQNNPAVQSIPIHRTTYADEIEQHNDLKNIGLFFEQGVTGLTRFGGFVYEEFLKQLQGKQGALTYREMKDNDPIIGAFLYAIEHLIRQVKWDVQPAGTKDNDKYAAEFLQTCLYDMSSSWSDTLSEILSFTAYGWSYHEICYKIRKGLKQESGIYRSKYNDGRIGWRKFAIRSQETLWRWHFQLDGGILGMEQLAAPDFRLRYIPIEKALLFRVKPNKNNPEGRSLLRNAYYSWYVVKNLRDIEAIGVEKDLVGIPMLYLPPEAFDPDGSVEAKKQKQWGETIIKNLKRNEQEGLLLPSLFDEQGRPLVRLELLTAQNNRRQFDVDKIIKRYQEEIALTVMADFLMLGSNGSKGGSYALSVNKSSLFQTSLMSIVINICDTINTYAIPRLFELNDFGDLTDYPKLTHNLIEKVDLTTLGNYIKNLVGSDVLNVTDDTKLENFLRAKGEMPLRQDYEDTPSIAISDSTGNTRKPNFEKTARSLRSGGDGFPKYPSVSKSATAVNLTSISQNVASRILEEITMLENNYPVDLKSISSGEVDDDTFAVTNTVHKTILLNEDYFCNEKDISKSIHLAEEVNWHPKILEGEELESVIAHEYGHLVFKAKIKGTHLETKFNILVWDKVTNIPKDAVSIYGTKNSHEYFAELFSCVLHGSDNARHGEIATTLIILNEAYGR